MHGNDYFVLFHKQDESKVMDAGVYVPKKNNQNSPQLSSVALIKKHTREITMTDDDVLEFKSNINKFKSVRACVCRPCSRSSAADAPPAWCSAREELVGLRRGHR